MAVRDATLVTTLVTLCAPVAMQFQRFTLRRSGWMSLSNSTKSSATLANQRRQLDRDAPRLSLQSQPKAQVRRLSGTVTARRAPRSHAATTNERAMLAIGPKPAVVKTKKTRNA